MELVSFLDALKRVTPALGRGDLLPQLARLWFNGESVSAFDDNISISSPCPTDFKGGIDGSILTRTIEKSYGETIEVKLEKQAAAFKVGRTDLKLGIMDIESQPFTMPKRNKKALAVPASRAKLLEQLKFCLQSVGHDVTHPEWCGVTFELTDEELHTYSGYSQVLARGVTPLEVVPAKFERVILHEKFCQQILNYPEADLELYNDHGLLIDQATGVYVFGRSLGGSGTLNLWDIMQVALDRVEVFVKTPKLRGMLERASIFEGDHLNMQVSVVKQGKGCRIKMVSESGEGKLVDFSVTLAGDHPEVDVATNAKHLTSGADLAEIAIGADEIVMRDPDKVLVVSVNTR